MMIPYQIISSGSKGNAVVINDIYMIDCGVPMKALENVKSRLSVILLTHRHGDHFRKSTIKALADQRPTLRWACCEWLVPELLMCGVSARQIDVLTPGQTCRYSMMEVTPFLVTHDVPNCGYKICFPALGKIFYATDCANLNGIEAKEYDLYMVEANHKTAEIDRKIEDKQAALEYAYEIRAKEMHLSEEDANDWLYRNMGPNSQYVYMHVHVDKENNNDRSGTPSGIIQLPPGAGRQMDGAGAGNSGDPGLSCGIHHDLPQQRGTQDPER